MREIYPELVFEDSQGYLSVNYIGLIPVLVEVIKEQQSHIEQMDKRINALEGKGFEKASTVVTSTAKLYQNVPNPFTNNTEIRFYIPDEAGRAGIYIYDMVGSQIMKIDVTSRGYSSITVHGNQLKAGMYMYSLLVNGREVDTKRMILTD